MPMLPHEVFRKMRSAKTKAEKIKILKENESWALKDIIRGSLDSTIVWNLPAGDPPYTASKEESTPATILRENKKFAYLVKGGQGDKLPAFKRENIFIGILEGIHPQDAAIVVDMINKRPPKPITRPIVNEAFPGLLRD